MVNKLPQLLSLQTNVFHKLCYKFSTNDILTICKIETTVVTKIVIIALPRKTYLKCNNNVF